MNKKTFTTEDSRGCQFICIGYYNGDETVYVADGLGVKAKTLKKLKILVGNL